MKKHIADFFWKLEKKIDKSCRQAQGSIEVLCFYFFLLRIFAWFLFKNGIICWAQKNIYRQD